MTDKPKRIKADRCDDPNRKRNIADKLDLMIHSKGTGPLVDRQEYVLIQIRSRVFRRGSVNILTRTAERKCDANEEAEPYKPRLHISRMIRHDSSSEWALTKCSKFTTLNHPHDIFEQAAKNTTAFRSRNLWGYLLQRESGIILDSKIL